MLQRTALIVLLAVSLSGCFKEEWERESKYVAEYNEKLTLHIATPNGPIEASAITNETITRHRRALFATGTIRTNAFEGEAVAVQLGDKWLFTTLKSLQFIDVYEVIPELKGQEIDPSLKAEDRSYLRARNYLIRVQRSKGKRFDVPREMYPMMVTFADLEDPASVSEVDPDDFEVTFGTGYELTNISVGVTGEQPTHGIVGNLIPWLTWDADKRREYTCGIGDCGIYPFKLPQENGTIIVLNDDHFRRRAQP